MLCILLLCAWMAEAAKDKADSKKADEKAAAEEEAKKGARRGLKDWQKFDDKKWRDLEDSWLEDEEEDPEDEVHHALSPFNQLPPDRCSFPSWGFAGFQVAQRTERRARAS